MILDTEEEAGGDGAGAGAGPPAPGLGLGSAGSSSRALLRRMSASGGAGGFSPRGISANGSRMDRATPSPGVHIRTPTPAVAAAPGGAAGGADLSRIPSVSGTNPVPLQPHGRAPSGGLHLNNMGRASSRAATTPFAKREVLLGLQETDTVTLDVFKFNQIMRNLVR